MSIDVPAVTEWVLRAATFLGPILCGLALVLLLRLRFAAGRAGVTRMRIAFRGLEPTVRRRSPYVAGLLVPVIGATSLMAAFAIEEEVRLGPNRAAASDQSELLWVLQDGSEHFMNTSRLPADTAERLTAAAGGFPDIRLSPLYAVLAQIEADSGPVDALVMGMGGSEPAPLSPEVVGSSSCELVAGTCLLAVDELVVGPGDGFGIGDDVAVRGQGFRVVATMTSSRSMLNRPVVVVSDEGFRRFEGDDPTLFAVLVSGVGAADLDRLVDDAGLGGSAEVLTADEVNSSSTNFWRGNGTPVLMLLIALISIFAAASMLSTRRAEQERNKGLLGVLRSMGLTRTDLWEVDLANGALTVFRAAVPSAIVGYGVVELAAAGIVGFSPTLRAPHVFAALGVMLLSSQFAMVQMGRALRRTSVVDMLRE